MTLEAPRLTGAHALAQFFDLASLAGHAFVCPSISPVAVSLNMTARVLSIYHGQTKILANGDGRFIIRLSIPANDKNHMGAVWYDRADRLLTWLLAAGPLRFRSCSASAVCAGVSSPSVTVSRSPFECAVCSAWLLLWGCF